MTDLAQFLLVRIAEDEERGRSLVAQWSDVGNACQSCGTDGARVVAECEAKRRIVVRCQEMQVSAVPMAVHLATQTLDDLARVYAAHPDYQPEWAEAAAEAA